MTCSAPESHHAIILLFWNYQCANMSLSAVVDSYFGQKALQPITAWCFFWFAWHAEAIVGRDGLHCSTCRRQQLYEWRCTWNHLSSVNPLATDINVWVWSFWSQKDSYRITEPVVASCQTAMNQKVLRLVRLGGSYRSTMTLVVLIHWLDKRAHCSHIILITPWWWVAF